MRVHHGRVPVLAVHSIDGVVELMEKKRFLLLQKKVAEYNHDLAIKNAHEWGGKLKCINKELERLRKRKVKR